MRARYRIVQFVPDPFTGARVPIGAVADVGDERALVVHAPPPEPRCAGGAAGVFLIQTILADLQALRTIDEMPGCLGPHARASEAREIPRGIEHGQVETWLETLFPHPPRDRRSHVFRQRATEGLRFFESYQVDRYVRRDYRAPKNTAAHDIGAVTHYVRGQDGLLLMEPISYRRPNPEDDVRHVLKNFAAFESAFAHDAGEQPTFIAYFLAGGQPERRAAGMNKLFEYATIIDTAQDGARAEFLERIRASEPELVT